MKVKDIIALLQHFDPEASIHIDVKNDSYTRAWTHQKWGPSQVYLTSLGEPEGREQNRLTFHPVEGGEPISSIQLYTHLRAGTVAESRADLEAGAITAEEHEEDCARIAEKERLAAQRERLKQRTR